MATTDKLAATAVTGAKARGKPYKLFDGGGLYLLVRTDGSRYWRLKYRVDGKEKLISLGVYPDISLKRARELRDAARKLIRTGSDPSEHRQTEKANRRSAAENTVEAVAREWFAKKSRTWAKNNATIVIRRLENDVFPEIGRDAISKITGPVLRK